MWLFISIFLFTILFMELATLWLYGGYIREEIIYTKLLQTKTYQVNSLDSDIITLDSLTPWNYISILGWGWSFKYQIEGYGVVPRGSKTHYFIQEIYQKSKK